MDNPQQPMSHKEAKASVKAQKAYAKATRPWYMKKRFWALGIVAVLIIGSALANMGNSSAPAASSATTAAPSSDAAATPTVAPAQTSAAAPAPATPDLTAQQRNAVRAAENYLSFKGFSRKGLINQLSSDAGDGFPVADATIAVDSLDVDWNAQAVRAAEAYLDFKGFSCSGLKEQLSSDAGDGFTAKQAAYGAEQAGACD